ncbi:MAG TPA: signal peptidase II [Bryobacteraceae bacterium]|nr:signal peptidase II [Bryobacteraceae bacterium]
MDSDNGMLDIRWKAYGMSAGVFALDRLTKWFVDGHVSFFDTYQVIPGFFDIVRSQNRGVAFGIFNDSNSPWRTSLLVAASIAAVVVVSVMLWRATRLDRLSLCGLALILGGAAGNVFDRIVWGRVTDFLLFYIRDYQWPAFNMADSAIVIGSGLLMLDLLRSKRQAANVS